MGRRKGRNYIQLMLSVEPEQYQKLEGIPNRSRLLRGLLDLYFKQWHTLIKEYLNTIADIKTNTTHKTETRILELAERVCNDPEFAKRWHPPLVAQLKHLKELRGLIPKELMPT